MTFAMLDRSALFGALAGALVIGGCSSDGDDDGDAGPPGTPGASSGPGSSPSPIIDIVPETARIGAYGTVYVDRDVGLPLYIRPTDEPGAVTCTDSCAETWSPLVASFSEVGENERWSVVERPDGSLQWAYRDYPLYLYSGDGLSGEANGDGIDGEWFLARPIPIGSADSAEGEVLAVDGSVIAASGVATDRLDDYDGWTLYRNADDTAGVSNCNDACADTWIPLRADAAAIASSRYGLVDRDDGTRQWTYEDLPLYVYSGDSESGALLGEGVEGWSAVRQ